VKHIVKVTNTVRVEDKLTNTVQNRGKVKVNVEVPRDLENATPAREVPDHTDQIQSGPGSGGSLHRDPCRIERRLWDLADHASNLQNPSNHRVDRTLPLIVKCRRQQNLKYNDNYWTIEIQFG
jgi:hypothetical protein